MSDVKPTPAAPRRDSLYQAKGPQNDGGYIAAGQNDGGLFRDPGDPLAPAPPQSDGWGAKGPQNDGGYGIRGAIANDPKAAPPADPLFTDKVDIQFKPGK